MNNDVVIMNLDRPRTLRLGHIALKTLVELTGKTIDEIDNAFDLTNFDFVEKLSYCAMLGDALKYGETLTLDKIPELLDHAPTQAHVLDKLLTAWRVAFGAPAEIPEGNPPLPEQVPAKENDTIGKKV